MVFLFFLFKRWGDLCVCIRGKGFIKLDVRDKESIDVKF